MMKKHRGKQASEETPSGADGARREFIIRAASGIVGTTLLLSGEARSADTGPPKNLFYTEEHVWAHVNGRVATVGVSNYVQSSLGKIGCVEFSPCQVVGNTLCAGRPFGSIAAVDTFELKVPVSGKLVEINEALTSNPGWINSEAYGKGWMIKIQLTDRAELGQLMDVPGYEAWVKRKPPLKTHRDRIDPSDKKFAYVVADPCVDCKYTDCAVVCPVDAFHEMPNRLLINQETCIECDACVPECPVEAIFMGDKIPEEFEASAAINFEAENYPVICYKKPALRGPKCASPPDNARAGGGNALVGIHPRTT